jgi:hypothetical protein
MDDLAVADQERKRKSKDMHRMLRTTEPLSRNLLDETFFWILAGEKERPAVRTHNSPGTRYDRSSNTQFRARDLPSASIAC